jgi:hypothetical protein
MGRVGFMKKYGLLLLLIIVWGSWSVTRPVPRPAAAIATSGPSDSRDPYDVQSLEGWTVRVNRELSDGKPKLCAATLKLLRFQLYQITREVPQPALGKIQTVVIWVELNDPLFPCMCYHADRDWVVGHGLDPRKTHGVEMANAANFLDWEHTQPWMVLHELGHAYHHDFLPDGFENPDVKAAYGHARDKGLYDAVLRNNGRTERAYAMTNCMEYFSECTEAYFGTNDFYPFVRPELQVHDPQGYAMMKAAWESGSSRPTKSVEQSEKKVAP